MADRPRVAIVYDWLTSLGGAERVLDAVVELLPGAPIYTLLYRKEVFRGSLVAERAVHTSSLDRLPLARTHYRAFLPLMPWAVERFDLRDYDLIVSLSHAVAHGVLHRPDQLHISYTSTPARYAWSQPATALRERVGVGRAFAASWALHYFRLWDLSAAQRVDRFVAISHWVRRNVWRYYRRRAQVVYPPVDLALYRPLAPRGETYVTVSRLVPYKRVGLITEAFARLRLPLVVIGDGPEHRRLAQSAPRNVRFLGWQPDHALAELLGRAKAFVYAAEEDFGIAPVEAQASGCPVIAFGSGGVLETVIPEKTGIFYPEQTVESLIEAVERFEKGEVSFDVGELRRNAERFRRERFMSEFRSLLEREWQRFCGEEG